MSCEGGNVPTTNQRKAASVVSVGRSIRSRPTGVEVNVAKQIAVLDDGLAEKKATLEQSRATLQGIRKRIVSLKECWAKNKPDENDAMASRLIHEEIEAEDKVNQLEIEFDLEEEKVKRRKAIIFLERDADLQDIESEDEENKPNQLNHPEQVNEEGNEKVNNWLQGQACDSRRRSQHSENLNDEKTGHKQKEPKLNLTVDDLVLALNNFGQSKEPHRVYTRGGDAELPKFGGEPEKWIQFREEYDRTTRKYHFDDSENLLRLRKALVGQAKQTVQHLMANVLNVRAIMESLERRFGRPRTVLNALAARAKTCSNVSLSKPETIIELGLAVQSLVTNIVSFGEDGYLKNVELLDTLVKKLSPDLATRWYEWLAMDKSRREDIGSFAEWTSIHLDIAYQRADVKTEVIREDRPEIKGFRRNSPGAIHTTTSVPKCKFCGKDKHNIDRCFAFKKKTVDERWKIVKTIQPRICFRCLKEGHTSTECDGPLCPADGCSRNHHKLLHNDEPKKLDKTGNDENHEPDVEEGNMSLLQGSVAIVKGCHGPLPIVPVKIRGLSGVVRCYALLDTGASRSIMTKKVASALGVHGRQITYTYRGITGEPVKEENAMVLDCEISGILRGDKYYKMSDVVTVQELRMTPYSINMEEIRRTWPHLKNTPASSLENVVPDIIVGNNNPHLILARKLISGKESEPIGWRSNLGWTVAGNLKQSGGGSISIAYGSSDAEVHDLVKRSFSFEDFGVRLPKHGAKNLEEKRAYEILESTTRKANGKWETGLLWRYDHVSFPETEAAALNRLKYVERKMKDPVFAQAYRNKMAEYLEKGYMRKLTDTEKNRTTERTNIIAHFGHVNPNKPGKFRFILDAKAETKGVSLNNQLLKGPGLIQPLVAVLWNFRRFKVALTGDITDMFHRVGIRPEDQDSQRLLWRDGDPTRNPDHYVMTVMIFGATCSPASAIYVKNKNAEDYREKYPRAAKQTVNAFYVDDLLACCDTESEAIQLRRELTEIHEAGNFKICKWMSNSKQVIDSIPVELRAEGVKDFEDKDLPGERILGLWWDASSDTFGFRLGLHKVKASVLKGDVPTKRQMCGLIMSLYDPLGFIAHYKVKGLILLQEVWRDGTGWDDEIQMATYEKWRQWLSRLEDIRKVNVPRCYSFHLRNPDSVQLHVFSDASTEALSAVCYIRTTFEDNVDVSLLNAKARVAPLKKTTIPRLELQAALLGCRLAMSVKEMLRVKIDRIHFWIDSSTVLFWIRSRAGKLKEFVANRVGEIQEYTELEQWHWIPTKLNVADQATRFDSEVCFSPDCQWFRGPPFLFGPADTWNFEQESQMNKKQDGIVSALKFKEEVKKQNSRIRETTPVPEKFSMYTRLVRATAATEVAGRYWISRIRNRPHHGCSPWSLVKRNKSLYKSTFESHIKPSDIYVAEKKLIKMAQEESFSLDEVGSKTCPLRKLSPVVDAQGFVRVDSRIQAAKGLSFSTCSPIILPARHHVTNLLIQFEHVRNGHQGQETVLANLRKKYWIISGRHTVAKAFKQCQTCRLSRAKPVIPRMGLIPSTRLQTHQPPFSCTGVDLFGPVEVTVGRRHEKRWGTLFCCMVTRGVHIEVVHGLSTEEFLMALSRFVDTRGRPSLMVSDNGSNFIGTSRFLQEKWGDIDPKKICQDARFQKIDWQFNPPLAPHMGGAWERLIQIVKKCLLHTLKSKYPRDTVLLTALKGAENMLNSRPLTYQSADASDPVAITPNHILRGSCHSGPAISSTLEQNDHSLRNMWGQSQVIQDQFWEHWNRFYLPKLILREKWHDKKLSLQVGDIVSLVDEQTKSNFWKRGYVSRVFPGADNEIRVVEVTVREPGAKQPTVYNRASTRVCPLGLKMEIKDRFDP